MNGPDRTDDELVSAVLDGEATDDERARVAASPELQTRLEAFRSVQQWLATDDERAPAGRDDRVAAALAAAGPDPTEADGSDTGGTVTAIDSRARRVRAAQWLGAAAAVAVVVIGATLAVRSGGTSDDTASESTASSDTAAVSTTVAGPAGPAGPATAESGATKQSDAAGARSATLTDLGSFSSIDALRNALVADDVVAPAPAAGAVTTPPRAADAAVPCGTELAARGATPVATASVSGTPVVIGRSATGIVVLTAAGCAPL